MFDVCVGGDVHDIAEDLVAEGVVRSVLAKTYSGVVISPPHGTFAGAGDGPGAGHRTLRGAEPPDLYGVPGLTPEEKEATRLETLLAMRAVLVAGACADIGVPWSLRCPAAKPGLPSMLNLPEVKALLERPGATDATIMQHRLGAPTPEPVTFRGTVRFEGPPAGSGPQELNRIVVDGLIAAAGAASAAGGAQAPPRKRGRPEGRGESTPSGGTAAVSPSEALLRAQTAREARRPPAPSAAGSLAAAALEPARVQFTARLRGDRQDPRELRRQQDRDSLAGLRNAADAVLRIDGHRKLGPILREFFDRVLDRDVALEAALLRAVEAQRQNEGAHDPGPSEVELDRVRAQLARVLCTEDTGPVDTGVSLWSAGS